MRLCRIITSPTQTHLSQNINKPFTLALSRQAREELTNLPLSQFLHRCGHTSHAIRSILSSNPHLITFNDSNAKVATWGNILEKIVSHSPFLHALIHKHKTVLSQIQIPLIKPNLSYTLPPNPSAYDLRIFLLHHFSLNNYFTGMGHTAPSCQTPHYQEYITINKPLSHIIHKKIKLNHNFIARNFATLS